MLFNQVTKDHIIQGIQDFKKKGLPNGFGPSSTYDLIYEGKTYPPKAVMAYANYHAEGREIENYFEGGEGTDCFKAFERNGLNIVIKSNKNMNENLYNLKNAFLKEWPVERLRTMALEEYTNLDKTSFCYWVEAITTDLGSIWGGSAYKFGIFKRKDLEAENYNDKRMTDGEYSWYGKYGETKEAVFNKIKQLIIKIANYSEEDRLEQIDNIDLGDAYKWKIAFLYGDFNVINMFNKSGLNRVVLGLGLEVNKTATISELNRLILDKKPRNEDFFEFSTRVWEAFGKENDKAKNFEKWLRKSENGTSKKVSSYLRAIEILTNHFKIKVYEEEDISTLKALYLDLKEHQTEQKGKYYYSHAPSYGINRFYSAAIKAYLEFLIDKHSMDDSFSFEEFIKQFSGKDLETYFSFLFEIMDKFSLKEGDERLSFNTSNNNLTFTIGQRYSWCLFKSNKKGKYGVLSKFKLRESSEEFSGNEPYPYYTYLEEVSFSEKDKDSIFQGIDRELQRTSKSGYRKHNNVVFEQAVFDNAFREKFIKTNKMENRTVLNQILYGPPGTGKTYQFKERLFDKYTIQETSITVEKHFEDTVANLTWWQVIALALLELGTAKANDILENRWVAKKAELSESKNVRATLWGTLQMHTILESKTVAYTQRQVPYIFDKNDDKTWSLLDGELKEQVPELYDILNAVNNFKANPNTVIKNYDFVTFHQSFAYEDFVEGIKPIMAEEVGESKELGYKIENGVFKNLCIKAQNDPDNKYAIFIDEINRGNVSAIFGELITLIEVDKRKGAVNELSIKLPYSKKEFSVPSNLDIYGSMNTADRSVEALDTALRRRFVFEEVMPNPSLLSDITFKGFNLERVLTAINDRVEALLDRDHTIGHSYFIKLESGDTTGLSDVFNNNIIPLLQEYFYNDYEKIALVLGPGFVKEKEAKKNIFPKFNNIDEPEMDRVYELIPSIDDIEKAVGLLLGISNE